MKNTLFHWAFTVGLLMVGVAIILLFINPREGNLPQGFMTPIVALEFIQTPAEVQEFFTIPKKDAYADALTTGNALDFPFMFLYSIFLFLTVYSIYISTGARALWVAMLLCPLVFFFDIMENIQLGNIILLYTKKDISPYLAQLNVFTWLKWGGISGIFLIISTYFLQGKWWMKAMGFLFVVQFLLAVGAFFNRGILNEIFASSVFLSFIFLILFCKIKN
jgi:hypothetical protein